MQMIAGAKQQSVESHHRRITLILILALFVLRIPLAMGVRFFVQQQPDWLAVTYQAGTYLLLAALLVWERSHLAEFHIDPLALWIIILFKPIQTLYVLFYPGWDSALDFPKPAALALWAASLSLLWAFRKMLFTRAVLRWKTTRWILFGLLGGLAAVLVTAFLDARVEAASQMENPVPVLAVLTSGLVTIPYQIGYAAVSEEPVFRGFLWGYLRQSGWRDLWIWLFQAGLFMISHLYYIKDAPLLFWASVPFGGLLLGWLAWRSRTITTSIMAHGVVNGLSRSVGIVLASLR